MDTRYTDSLLLVAVSISPILMCSSLSSLRDSKIPPRLPNALSPTLPALVFSLFQTLSRQNVGLPAISIPHVPRPPRLVSDISAVLMDFSTTVRFAPSSVPRPPAPCLPAATAPSARISTTASLAPNSQAIGSFNLPSLILSHRDTQMSRSSTSMEGDILLHSLTPIFYFYSA